MEDRVSGLISYTQREGSENVAIDNIWLHIAWNCLRTDESHWGRDLVHRISSKGNKKKFTPRFIVVKLQVQNNKAGGGEGITN